MSSLDRIAQAIAQVAQTSRDAAAEADAAVGAATELLEGAEALGAASMVDAATQILEELEDLVAGHLPTPGRR